MINQIKRKLIIAFTVLSLVAWNFLSCTQVMAKNSSFRISPMYQNISLIPGEISYGTFVITNPADNETNFHYTLYIQPFTAKDDDDVVFENNGDYNQIVDWITLEKESGDIAPNASEEIEFNIATPADAPAGGQYAAIMIRQEATGTIGDAVNLQQNYEISHLIYADVAGETVRKGEISDVNVNSFLFSGNITGTSKIKNVGNVHSRASHTLQVFPLFSDEEIYTNEENPDSTFIMPGTTQIANTSWDSTPSIGIFHVIYNVEFEGVNQKVDKMVIVCTLWILCIIAVIIFLIIFKILSGKKENK